MSRIQNLTMNRGEWSEAYALLTLITNSNFILSDKSLCDQNTNQYRVNSILISTDTPDKFVSLSSKNNSIIANYDRGNNLISIDEVRKIATSLFNKIQTSTSTTFSFNQLDSLWDKFFNPQIKANNSEKSDIQLEILDLLTNKTEKVGFSIKSNLGGATSLLNASQLTNFLYEAPHQIVIAESTPKKLGKFVKSLSLTHHGSVNQTYKQNLQRIDKNLEELVSNLLIEYYGSNNREKFIKDLLPILVKKNLFNFSNIADYKKIISKFLSATAFGMVPRVTWDGTLSANGGMIIVKDDGKLASFYLGNSQSEANLNEYLYENCFFDTASTSRHDFGKVFNEKFFKFNLLIRL
jgi:hypothetical protein